MQFDTHLGLHFHFLYSKTELLTDSPSNFYLTNLNNQSKFTYTKPLKSADTLILDGEAPFLNDKRCGIDTDNGIIKLEKGTNNFKVNGNAKIQSIEFAFPFIYR